MLDKILQAVSKYAGVDIKFYARNAVYLFFAYGVSVATAIVSSVALARLLSRDTFGEYSYILSIVGLASIFSLPGMNTAITQAVARGHDRVFVEGTKARLKWSYLGSVVVLGAGIYYLFKDSSTVGESLLIAALFFPAFHALDTFYSYLYGKKFFLTSSKLESIIKIISTITIVATVFFFRDIRMITLAYLGSISLLQIYIFIRIKKKYKLNHSIDEKSISYGKHLTFMNVILNTRKYYDKIVIANFLGFTDVAIYSIALGLSEQTKVIWSIFNTLILPDLAKKQEVAANEAVKKRLSFVVVVFGIICGIGILISPYMIPLLYSDKYTEAIFYTQLLFLSMFIATPGAIIINLLQSQKNTKKLYTYNFSFSVVEFALTTILIIKLNVLGVVLAKLISRTFSTLLLWKFVNTTSSIGM